MPPLKPKRNKKGKLPPTHSINLPPHAPMHEIEDGIPEKRPDQPARSRKAHRAEPQHDHRVQAERLRPDRVQVPLHQHHRADRRAAARRDDR